MFPDAIEEVKNLDADMEKADPAHAGLYRKNTDEYLDKLEALRRKMLNALAPYKGRSIITFHEAFPYFAQEFRLKDRGGGGKRAGKRAHARELADTVELVRKTPGAALFSEPQYPALAINTIARETDKKVYVLDPAVTGPDSDDAYIDIMEKNLEVLKKLWNDGRKVNKKWKALVYAFL